MTINRRRLIRSLAVGTFAAAFAGPAVARAEELGDPLAVPAAEPNADGPAAATQDAPSTSDLGRLLDYAAGVPSAEAIAAAGYVGAIRYVSDRRPGSEWMEGKPLLAEEVRALNALGLSVVSNYQFGKGETSDWRGGYEAGIKHAKRGQELHAAAGGPSTAPIYASIDDNPSDEEFHDQIAPYLRAWEEVIGKERVGVYGNSPTIENAVQAGLGTWFWQHNWGTPAGYVHPAAHLHQTAIDSDTVDGVGVDINEILKPDYGQWSESHAQAPRPTPPVTQAAAPTPDSGPTDGVESLLGKAFDKFGGLGQPLLGQLPIDQVLSGLP